MSGVVGVRLFALEVGAVCVFASCRCWGGVITRDC